MKRRYIWLLPLIVFGLFASHLSAQDNPNAAGVSQEAKTLRDNNLTLSREIAYVYQTLNSYVKLYQTYKPLEGDVKDGPNERWRQITYTPRQTIVTWVREDNKPQGKVVGFKMLQYDFLYPEGKRGIVPPLGSRSKSVALIFDDNKKLVKVVSEMREDDFFNHTTKRDYIIDENPHLDPETVKYVPYEKGGEKIDQIDDIKFKHIYTNGASYEKTLADMKLEISNPHRIQFKRDFYLKHLKNFENLFRLTEDYQRNKGDDQDAVVIEELKEMLDF